MPAPYCYEYPRPMVTVDLVVFALDDASLRVLLIRRGRDPFAGKWAIPGGFLDMDETAEDGARRELLEETGLKLTGPVAPIGFFDRPGRDPRGRTITLAHGAVVRSADHKIRGGDDAAEAAWITTGDPIELAFDHGEILERAIGWLTHCLLDRDSSLALDMLPRTFHARQAEGLFQALGLTQREAASWLERMVKSRWIRLDDAPGLGFHLVDADR